MKNILLPFIAIVIFACTSQPGKDKKGPEDKDLLLLDNAISSLIQANHLKLNGKKGDFQSYKLYLHDLSNDSLTSIPYALDFINTCISVDCPDRDSVFLMFNIKFYAVTNKMSDSLDTKYKTMIAILEKDSSTTELKNFKKNLAVCGIDIFSTEGTYYLDVIPDFFYKNFKNRVSEGVAEFLNIRKDELKEGFSEDAGLLISFEDLYHRVKRWENFLSKFPNTVYSDEANGFYTEYLETLMTGMDNSRIFDFEGNLILPEVKTLYESIMKEDQESPTTKIISSYYNFLGRHDFKENDSIQIFLKNNNLSTMLAVQPHNR